MSIVSDTVTAYYQQGAKVKSTPSGWLARNAPCCHHNGHAADTRQRGGLIVSPDGGISFHCFNCGFKSSWQPGRNLSRGMKRLMFWLGVPDDVVNRVALDVLRENEGITVAERKIELPTFHTVPLPEDAIKIADIESVDQHNMAVLEYMVQRNLSIDDTDYYWSPSLGYRDRLIVPFYYEKRIVGWTGRSVTPGKKPKYLTETQPGFVYGLDAQTEDRNFCIVCEGQIDAIHVQGCALGGSEISDQQALLLNRLQRQIVVVPDRDSAGSKLIERAIDLGWNVSMPNWSEDCNDIGDSVDRYGRLYTLYSIATSIQESPLKIRLTAKRWFK